LFAVSGQNARWAHRQNVSVPLARDALSFRKISSYHAHVSSKFRME
jgi:hypothetical protein